MNTAELIAAIQKYYHPEKSELDLSRKNLTDTDIPIIIPFLNVHFQITSWGCVEESPEVASL